jgi:hypothetical protein
MIFAPAYPTTTTAAADIPTVRTRSCKSANPHVEPYRTLIHHRALGRWSGPSTWERAYSQRAHKPRSKRPDLEFIPAQCFRELAEATCPRDPVTSPRFGSFAVMPGGIPTYEKYRLWFDAVLKFRLNSSCARAPFPTQRRLALLANNFPTGLPRQVNSTFVRVVTRSVLSISSSFVPPELAFGIPYQSGHGFYDMDTEGKCQLHPVAAEPGVPRQYLAVFLGNIWDGPNIIGRSMLRPVLHAECTLARDCTLGTNTTASGGAPTVFA